MRELKKIIFSRGRVYYAGGTKEQSLLKQKNKKRAYSRSQYLSYSARNKDIIRKRKKERYNILKIRKQKLLNIRIRGNLQRRIIHALKGNSKSASTLSLIGCNIDQFKIHIESKFKNGMNWNNYGLYGWHLDHIKPCKLFNLQLIEEQQKCFHYTNIQPLWSKDNLKKNDKYEEN